jgi:predicted neutral ceramidase superfamily lipid hydrolase
MQEVNDNIKKALQYKIQRIDDDSFTRRIVDTHLAKKQVVRRRPFINFLSFVIGLSSLLFSIGLVILIRLNYDLINGLGITEQHGLILASISIIFLIYKLIEEFTPTSTVYSSLARQ